MDNSLQCNRLAAALPVSLPQKPDGDPLHAIPPIPTLMATAPKTDGGFSRFKAASAAFVPDGQSSLLFEARRSACLIEAFPVPGLEVVPDACNQLELKKFPHGTNGSTALPEGVYTPQERCR